MAIPPPARAPCVLQFPTVPIAPASSMYFPPLPEEPLVSRKFVYMHASSSRSITMAGLELVCYLRTQGANNQLNNIGEKHKKQEQRGSFHDKRCFICVFISDLQEFTGKYIYLLSL